MKQYQNEWEWSKNVYFFETDSSGKLRLNLLSSYLQEIAWMHAEHLGFSAGEMADEKRFWALTRMMIQVEQMPQWKDHLKIKTWPRQPSGIFANRDFTFTLEQTDVVRATSSWVILNAENRRPILPDFSHLGNDFFKTKTAISDGIPKIHFPESKPIQEIEITPNPDEIDLNRHVNNTAYMNWFGNSIIRSGGAIPTSFELILNFTGEVFADDTVRCTLFRHDSGYIFSVTKSDTDKIAFTGEMRVK